MNNTEFSSLDNIPLSASDSDPIGKLTESNTDPADRAALQAALAVLFKQRNMLAYKVGELLDTATAVQTELLRKAPILQTRLDHANASIELQYRASLAKDNYADSPAQPIQT